MVITILILSVLLTGVPSKTFASTLDKFIQNFNKTKCVEAEFNQKSYIKLYKIWKVKHGKVYIKKEIGIIWIYPKKVTGIYNNKIFLFRKDAEPYIKRLSQNDPLIFLWKNNATGQFDIDKTKEGWQFTMKKNHNYKAIVNFDNRGFPIAIKQTDLFGNIIILQFRKQKFDCNFSIKRLFKHYLAIRP